MTGTFEGMLWGAVGFHAKFKFINENEIESPQPWGLQRSITYTRQSQDGSLMPMAPAGDVTMNRD